MSVAVEGCQVAMPTARSRFLGMSAAALATAVPRPSRADDAPLRIGTSAIDGYLEPYYAVDHGFFARAGLAADVQLFSGGARVTTALAANAIDIGISNPISLANAVDHGLGMAFIAAGVLYNRDAIALCVASDSPVVAAKDLNGKTIGATALEDSNTLHVRAWIDRNGGDSTTVQFVELPFSAMAAAIARGTVAAAPIAEPALTPALRAGNVRIFAHTLDVYGRNYLIGGWIARTDWVSRNTAAARKFAGAIYATARWANTHPGETAPYVARYAKIDLATVMSMNRSTCAEAWTPQLVQPALDLGYRYGLFHRRLTADDLLAKF